MCFVACLLLSLPDGSFRIANIVPTTSSDCCQGANFHRTDTFGHCYHQLQFPQPKNHKPDIPNHRNLTEQWQAFTNPSRSIISRSTRCTLDIPTRTPADAGGWIHQSRTAAQRTHDIQAATFAATVNGVVVAWRPFRAEEDRSGAGAATTPGDRVLDSSGV